MNGKQVDSVPIAEVAEYFQNMPEDLSLYPILKAELVITEGKPQNRLLYFNNPEEFLAGYGNTINEAIIDLVDSVKKEHGIP